MLRGVEEYTLCVELFFCDLAVRRTHAGLRWSGFGPSLFWFRVSANKRSVLL